MGIVALDTRDALVPPLRGWGRYARELLRALRALGAPVRPLAGRWPGPEVLWEQVGLPLGALARRSEEHTSELQSHVNLVCRLLLEKKKTHAAPVDRHLVRRCDGTLERPSAAALCA